MTWKKERSAVGHRYGHGFHVSQRLPERPWALATWSLAGLGFAVWTVANLAPRARSHHLWYRRTFPDYPPKRKALVPFLL